MDFSVMNMFQAKTEFSSWHPMSNDIRKVFRISRSKATHSDMLLMLNYVKTMPAFMKYHPSVRHELIAKSQYEKWDANRVIVKEGDVAHYFYFILEGEVEVTRKEHYIEKSLVLTEGLSYNNTGSIVLEKLSSGGTINFEFID